MPSLGADMESGTITHWLVHPGDVVHRGDIVAVVQTDKSDIEVEIFDSGTIEDIVVPEGQRVPVGTVLAHVASTKATPPPSPAGPGGPPTLETPAVAVPAIEVPAVEVPTTAPTPAPLAPQGAEHVSAPVGLLESPLVRHRAEQLGVDLSSLTGSGPGGALTRADVERAGAARAPKSAAPPSAPHRAPSSPFARRRAGELGVDLSLLTGSGPGGAIVERDVRDASRRPAPGEATPTGSVAPDQRRAMQRAIGALMARSKREIPHYYLSTTIDLTTATSWVERANLDRAITDRIVMAALLLRATARAVQRVPEMNGYYTDGAFSPRTAVHLGVGISQRGGGLIAPAIHDADSISLDELMRRLKDLVQRARTGVLRSSEMSDPTLTVTNLGDLGVDTVFGVIYPPQVAIVGFGRVREQPWVHDHVVDARPCVVATLSADHRVSDGMRGARFLTEIDHLLQRPEDL